MSKKIEISVMSFINQTTKVCSSKESNKEKIYNLLDNILDAFYEDALYDVLDNILQIKELVEAL